MDFSSLDLNALVNDYAIPWGIRIALALVIFYLGRGVVALVVRGV
jgi:small conductance mechanosensitive channel